MTSYLRSLLALWLVATASATHFRFATISHKPGASPGQVEFTVKLAYRRSFQTSWQVGNIGDLVSSSGRWKLGDGTQATNPPLYITGFSAENDWVFLEGTTSHTYSDLSLTYFAEFESCCRISTLLNNRNANYISRTKVSFPGRGNESPVSSGLPIVEVLQGSSGQFEIPFEDTDNDQMNCTQADPINTLGRPVTDAYPPWLTVDNAGTVSYNTTEAAVGLWNFAVQINDDYSYIHVDFIVQVKERISYCDCAAAAGTRCASSTDCAACGGVDACSLNVAPVIVPPSPQAGSTVGGNQGIMTELLFYATDSNAQDEVTLLMVSGPAGAVITSTVVSNGTSSATVKWTPPIGSGGDGFYVQIFCVWAQDNHGLQSTQYCINVLVDPVTAVPDPPAAPTLIKASGQALTVEWASANVTDARTLLGFELYMNGTQQGARIAIGAATQHTADYLNPTTTYMFTLTLCNRLGCSVPSSAGVFATLAAGLNPPSAPVLLTRAERTITVSWSAPYVPPGRVLSSFALTRTAATDGAAVVTVLPAATLQYQATGLQPASTHTFTVAACETLQCGRASEPAVFDSLDGFSSLCDQTCSTPAAGALLAHWALDEGTGSVAANAVAGGPEAVLHGAVGWKPGERGKAVELDGSSYLSAPQGSGNVSLDVLGSGDYSVCLWRRLHTGLVNGNLGVSLLSKGGSASNASSTPVHIVETFPGNIEMIIADGTTKLSGAIVTVPYELDTWKHLCFVRDRGLPTSTAQACTRTGLAYNGMVLNQSSPVQSAVLCQHSCSVYSGCVGFNWEPAAYRCTLLGSTVNSTAQHSTVSGPAVCGPKVVGYLDGALHINITDSTQHNVTNTHPLYMGNSTWDAEQGLVGRLDEVLLYSRALTAAQVAAVFSSCLPVEAAALECAQCPLDVNAPWPLMENYQTGGQDPLGCRDCCATKCDTLCFAQGQNPGRCMGSSPDQAYRRCMGTGYAPANCSHTNQSILSGCSFEGTVRRCPNDCALQGAAEGTYGKCDTWTGKCTFPVDCASGYTQVGTLCLDTDECAAGQYGATLCAGRSAVCSNTVGSFDCSSCLPGFTGNASVSACTNIDECAAAAAVCSPVAQCVDSAGSFGCVCPAGYAGDGTLNGTGCVDVDECRTGTHNCSITADCDNTAGNYSCSCKSGFLGNGYDNSSLPGVGTGCEDRDECADGTHTCGAHSECDNEIGHYDCNCVGGYTDSGNAASPCIDIDECALGMSNCTVNSECVNLPGNFSCECNAGFSGDGFAGSCARCISQGSSKAIVLDGANDYIALSQGSTAQQLSGPTGFSAQVWLNRDEGGSSALSSFVYDVAYNYSAQGSLLATVSAGSVSFSALLACSFNASSSPSSQGLSFFLGLQGAHLIAGVTINSTNTVTRAVLRSVATTPSSQWLRASASYESSTAQLSLWLDNQLLASASLAQNDSSLLELNTQLTLGGDLITGGSFKGRLREARVWDSTLTQRNVLDSDCQWNPPLLRFVWSGSSSSGDGCPANDYCVHWVAPAVCYAAQHIACGVVVESSSTASTGSLNATWTLMYGAAETPDWPLAMHDGSSYWHRLTHATSLAACTTAPGCFMAVDKTTALPTPVFRYVAGLVQSHIGTACTGTPIARLLLNTHACLREFNFTNGTTGYVAAYGSTYADTDKWDCGDAFIGTGLQEAQTMSQAGSVSCALPVAGPGLTLGSADGYVYVQ